MLSSSVTTAFIIEIQVGSPHRLYRVLYPVIFTILERFIHQFTTTLRCAFILHNNDSRNISADLPAILHLSGLLPLSLRVQCLYVTISASSYALIHRFVFRDLSMLPYPEIPTLSHVRSLLLIETYVLDMPVYL